jgi:hypothetical protein
MLPDNVSITTSDHHGTELKAMYELWASFIESLGDKQDVMWHTMLDMADELQASLFNSLCGYYRVASACLRSALELATIGVYFQLCSGLSEYLEWRKGKCEASFGMACDHLLRRPRIQPIEDYIKLKMDYSIFGQRSSNTQSGWARKLYSELSEYTHSRLAHSFAKMWEMITPTMTTKPFIFHHYPSF